MTAPVAAPFVICRWPRVGKLPTLGDYMRSMSEPRSYDLVSARVTQTIRLSKREWGEFVENLLEPREWLRGTGGLGSAAEGSFRLCAWTEWTADDWFAFRSKVYVLAVEVLCEDGTFVYVDAQGSSYVHRLGVTTRGGPVDLPEPAPAEPPVLSGTLALGLDERLVEKVEEPADGLPLCPVCGRRLPTLDQPHPKPDGTLCASPTPPAIEQAKATVAELRSMFSDPSTTEDW